MKKKKYPKLEDYDLSDYIELTGDILYKINGGAQIENSNEAVAQAQVGDTLERKDGTVVEITQGDIDWANEKEGASSGDGGSSSSSVIISVSSGSSSTQQNPSANAGSSSNNSSAVGSSSSGNSSYSSNQNDGSSAFSSSSTYSNPTTAVGSKTSSDEQNFLKTQSNNSDSESTSFKGFFDSQNPTRYIVDLDNRKELQKAADLLAETELGIKVTAYGSESGITKNFKNYAEINDYLNDNHSLIAEEINVKKYLKNIENNPDNYSIDAYQRKAFFTYPWKKNELLTHSLYVITNKTTGEKSTLSFNGAGPIKIISQGAWGLNTEVDIKGWNSYVEGNNDYDMSLYRGSDGIDVQKTAANIIASINSNTSYMALDHKWDWFNWENCNTALYNTMAKKQYSCSLNLIREY